MSEPPTKKIRSLTAEIINAADDVNLAAKPATTQEDGSVAYYTTHTEEALSEISKASKTLLLKTRHRIGKLPQWRQVEPGTITSVIFFIIIMKIEYFRKRKK